MAEEPLIKRKLLLDGDGTGDDKRLHTFVKQFAKWMYSDESPDDEFASYNKLLAQLHSFELSRRKLDLCNRCNVNQLAKFNMIQTTFEGRTELIKGDIERQQNLLKRAKVVKKNQVEYDLLVQTVNKQPCRKELKRKIDQLNQEVTDLEKIREHLGNKLNSKVKQCHVLSTSANAIKNSLKAENGEWETLSTNSEVSELDLQVTIN